MIRLARATEWRSANITLRLYFHRATSASDNVDCRERLRTITAHQQQRYDGALSEIQLQPRYGYSDGISDLRYCSDNRATTEPRCDFIARCAP